MGESRTTGGKDAASAPVKTCSNCCRYEPFFTGMNLKHKLKKKKSHNQQIKKKKNPKYGITIVSISCHLPCFSLKFPVPSPGTV